MRRLPITLPLLGCLCLVSWLARTPYAQPLPKDRARGQRPSPKPGEVVTRPDRSEPWSDQLSVGQIAPEFSLPLLLRDTARATAAPGGDSGDVSRSVALRDLRAKRPVVLIFGSITCPPFRQQLEGVERVYQKFRDRAEFLFVYIREAHPDSILSVVDAEGGESLLKISQPTDLASRAASATVCQQTVQLSLPIAVDTMDNAVGKAYAGWPNRMAVVGIDGRIRYLSAPSPSGTDARRLNAWLENALAPPAQSRGRAGSL